MKKIIIAIDGHSSCGKSTVAKDLAKELKYKYVDTGGMYRCVTLFALENGLIKNGVINEDALESKIADLKIDFAFDAEKKQNVAFLNEKNVEDVIRGLEVSKNVSAVSAIRFVRVEMVKQQQAMGAEKALVMDGRDIGTVVFPEAELKIFMTASPEVRAQRRFDELTAKGDKVNFDEILENVKQRDHLDSTRKESPLMQANDALLLDNSNMGKEEQMNWILEKINKIIGNGN